MRREPYHDGYHKYNPVICPFCRGDAYEQENSASQRTISCKCFNDNRKLDVRLVDGQTPDNK